MSQGVGATGVKVAEQLFREQYTARTDIHGAGEGVLLRIESHTLGALRFDRISGTHVEGITSEPMGIVMIGRSRTARIRHRPQLGPSGVEPERLYNPGDVNVATHGELPMSTQIDNPGWEFVALPPTVFDEVASTRRGRDGPVRLIGHDPISPQAAELWWRTYTFARDAAQQREELDAAGVATQLYSAQVTQLLAATTLACFPHNAHLDPTVQDRHDAHPASVRRAMAFIESRPDQPISVVDIARAAYVTPRALQLAFRRHLGTTPMAYLRQVRPEGAHADLRAADPARTTVTAIAARWGFANPGRFADHYRRAYGRSPSAALEA